MSMLEDRVADLQSQPTTGLLADGEPGRIRNSLLVDVEVQLPSAHVFVARLDHPGPDRNLFRRQGVYWIDMCLTPRRPNASARYRDHWSPCRNPEMGPIVVFPPRKRLELRSPGGKHVSLICQLKSDAVEKWLPDDFVWTDRRLEASLNIASESIRSLLLRLNLEIRKPNLGREALCEAIAAQLSIEIARYFIDVNGPDEKGGLATWRHRIIDQRVVEPGVPPSVAELAALCRISTRQLRRGFKANRGCSISEYLAQARIQTAKRRLTTCESLAEIASSLGYASQSNFTASFRRATGTTPNRFRQHVLKERDANVGLGPNVPERPYKVV